MKRWNWARMSAFCASLALIAGACVLYALERSGWLHERVRSELRARLGDDIELADVELRWFDATLVLHDLRLRGDDPAVALKAVEVALAWRAGAPTVAQVDISGGRVRLSNELLQRIEETAARDVQAAPQPAREVRVPTVVVRGLQLEWVHPEWGTSPIGRVDAQWHENAAGIPEIQGRIAPAFAAPDAGPTPEVFLQGSRDATGRIELHASCSGVPITAEALPKAPELAAVRPWDPRASLSFQLDAAFRLDASAPPSGHLRATLAGGSLRPPTTTVPVTDVVIDVDAGCDAVSLAGLLDPSAWRITAHLAAQWNKLPFDAWGFVGTNAGAGLSARAWLHAPHLELTRDALDATGFGTQLAATWNALAPHGTVDLVCGARWPLAKSIADEEVVLSPQIVADVRIDGALGMTYFGWPITGGTRLEGFPLPMEGVSGRVLALHDARRARRTEVALLELLAHHSSATSAEQPAFGEGLIVAPLPSEVAPLLELRFGGHGIPVDSRLRSALEGLAGTEFIWPEFSPNGGSVSARVRISGDGKSHVPATHISADLAGVGATWSAIPAQLVDLHGTVEFNADPRLCGAVSVALAGRTVQGATVSVNGRVQDDPAAELARQPWAQRHIECFDVALSELALRGVDRESIVGALPGVGQALDLLMPQGRIDLRYRSSNARSGAPREWHVEAQPTQALVTPSSFRVLARNVRGRVVVDGADMPAHDTTKPPARGVRTRVLPLVGEWPGDARIGALADFPPDGDGRVELFGAGIDLSNKGLVGAFRESRQSGVGGGHEGLGLAALNVDGRVDFWGELVLPQFLPARPLSVYRAYLRDNDVQTAIDDGRFQLGHLRGILEQREDELQGERITATLAGTPIVLRDARFREQAERFRMTTRIDALEVTLDREHLRPFLDEATVEALLGDLAWRGEIDLEDARLELSGASNDAGGEVRFSGDLRPRAMSIDFGVPLEIDSARVRIDDLVYRDGAVHASAFVEDLQGRLSDRRLTDTSLRLEYADPRLSIEQLRGRLEEGVFRNIDGDKDGAPPAFSIELAPPYRFDLAIDLDDAQVSGMLRGLFESEFASRGFLSGQMRLDGDLERMTGIAGKGELELRETNLWSIPVVRDLFSQLGGDSQAVFEKVALRFAVANGVLRMDDLAVSSPLLQLVGAGTLDFDGSLAHDLEVRYSLVDILGPLNRLLYWIQNSLLRVSIRGDMARPRVVLKGALSGLGGVRRNGRDLPLPEFAPLPERF